MLMATEPISMPKIFVGIILHKYNHCYIIERFHIGFIQSVRELPGFLSLLVVYVLLIVKEHRLSAISVLILGIGVALTGLMPSFYGLIFTTLVMSFGFHYYETCCQSLTDRKSVV